MSVLLGTQGLGFVFLCSPAEGGEAHWHHPVPGLYLWQKPVTQLFLPSATTLLSEALAFIHPLLALSPEPWDSGSPHCPPSRPCLCPGLQARLSLVMTGWNGVAKGPAAWGKQGAECSFLLSSWHCGPALPCPPIG